MKINYGEIVKSIEAFDIRYPTSLEVNKCRYLKNKYFKQ